MVEAQDAFELYLHSQSAGNEALKKLGLRPVEVSPNLCEHIDTYYNNHKTQNVFWGVRNSDPHWVLSFDQLHYFDGGLGGKHLLGEYKKVLGYLGRPAEAAVEK